MCIEDEASSNPIKIINIETIKPAIYSILPCPKGCSASGFFPAILKPIMEIIEEPASERLLKASAVIATDFAINPAKSFPQKRKIFNTIPTAPHKIP